MTESPTKILPIRKDNDSQRSSWRSPPVAKPIPKTPKTSISAGPFGAPPPTIPRKFICDHPFYLFLWKEDAQWPYLATWIDGPDCLTPFKKQTRQR